MINSRYNVLNGDTHIRIRKLLLASYSPVEAQKRIESLNWTCEHNPQSRAKEYHYFTISDNTRMLAYNCRMPVQLICDGNKADLYFVHETLTHPKFRRRGLGLKINEFVLNSSAHMCAGLWANEKLLPLLKKIGWENIGELRPFVKVLKVNNLLKRKIKSTMLLCLVSMFGRIYLRYFTKNYTDISNSARVDQISRFDDDLRAPLDHIIRKFNIITYRSIEYLNWKYVDIPYRDYKLYGVWAGNKFTGYIVLRVVEEKSDDISINKGTVIDMCCDPDKLDCFEALLGQAESYFKKKNVDYIVFLLTSHLFFDTLKKHSYYLKKTNSYFLIANKEKFINYRTAMNFNNWFLTYGDSDYDMLSGKLNSK